jgi:hypothetical protein
MVNLIGGCTIKNSADQHVYTCTREEALERHLSIGLGHNRGSAGPCMLRENDRECDTATLHTGAAYIPKVLAVLVHINGLAHAADRQVVRHRLPSVGQKRRVPVRPDVGFRTPPVLPGALRSLRKHGPIHTRHNTGACIPGGSPSSGPGSLHTPRTPSPTGRPRLQAQCSTRIIGSATHLNGPQRIVCLVNEALYHTMPRSCRGQRQRGQI